MNQAKWTWSDRLALALACLGGVLAVVSWWVEKTWPWAVVSIASMVVLAAYPITHFFPNWKHRIAAAVVTVIFIGLFGWWIWPASVQPASTPPASNFLLTVYLHGSAGPKDIILKGRGYVLIDTGGLQRKADIGENGEAIFVEIPANFRGQEVPVGLDADGYELTDPHQKIKLDASSAYLEIRRKAARIAGHAEDENGTRLTGVTMDITGITAVTDATGHFELTIPGEQAQSSLTLRAAAPGFLPWSDTVVPNSNEVTVVLSRKRR